MPEVFVGSLIFGVRRTHLFVKNPHLAGVIFFAAVFGFLQPR